MPPKREDDRSRSKTPEKPRKRHRSLERYQPAARRRRDTSSVSSTAQRKRQKSADVSDDERGKSKRRRRDADEGTLKGEEVSSDS